MVLCTFRHFELVPPAEHEWHPHREMVLPFPSEILRRFAAADLVTSQTKHRDKQPASVADRVAALGGGGFRFRGGGLLCAGLGDGGFGFWARLAGRREARPGSFKDDRVG